MHVILTQKIGLHINNCKKDVVIPFCLLNSNERKRFKKMKNHEGHKHLRLVLTSHQCCMFTIPLLNQKLTSNQSHNRNELAGLMITKSISMALQTSRLVFFNRSQSDKLSPVMHCISYLLSKHEILTNSTLVKVNTLLRS